jgi:hypothetical protein
MALHISFFASPSATTVSYNKNSLKDPPATLVAEWKE